MKRQLDLWGSNHRQMPAYAAYAPNRAQAHTIAQSGRSVRVADLFSGIGGFHIGLEHAAEYHGIRLQLAFASDIDADACQVYAANFGVSPLGDIKDVDASAARGVDLICAGFPCQPFSNSGLKKGFQDERGTLYDHIEKFIVSETPRAFLLENVSGLLTNGRGHLRISRLHADGHAKRVGATMQHLETRLSELNDYEIAWALLDSSHFGSPQVRRRVYIVGIHRDLNYRSFAFPDGLCLLNTMRQVLDVDAGSNGQYALNPNQHANILADMTVKRLPSYRDGMRRIGQAYHCRGGNVGQAYHVDGLVPTLTVVWARFLPIYLPHELETLPTDPCQEVYDPGPYYGRGILRRATPRECLRLQGFPDDFIMSDSVTQAYCQAGNAVHCSVVMEIAKNLLTIIA